jgi:hypothetical protein
VTRKTRWQKERDARVKAREELEKKQAACKHPLASATAGTDTIMNCPAEGWPDEEVVAIICGACQAVRASTTERVVDVLLQQVKELSARIERLEAATEESGA